jgi:hypothetical protein
VCDIIWCKEKLPDGGTCDTVNYLDPYNFWNWEGRIKCVGCDTVFYIHMIQGFMYRGPEKRPGEKPDILPLYADKPLEGYSYTLPGVEGKTRPYSCLPRDIYLGRADMVKFSVRGRPVRGWRPQPPSAGTAGSFGFQWDIQKLSPEVWKEYLEKIERGEVKEW